MTFDPSDANWVPTMCLRERCRRSGMRFGSRFNWWTPGRALHSGRPATTGLPRICLRCRTASPKTSSMFSARGAANSPNSGVRWPGGSSLPICAPMTATCSASRPARRSHPLRMVRRSASNRAPSNSIPASRGHGQPWGLPIRWRPSTATRLILLRRPNVRKHAWNRPCSLTLRTAWRAFVWVNRVLCTGT